jgi:hypothetical protein
MWECRHSKDKYRHVRVSKILKSVNNQLSFP